MPAIKSCVRCGSAAKGEWNGGLCPACVLEFALLELAPPAEGPFDPAAPPTGRVFGDYELLAEIAVGGMGVVYRARQLSLNRVVAVKMIRAGHLARSADIRRFCTESEAAAKLQHPNIVAIHEVGEHDGQHYFSMDFVDGKSLDHLIREHPFPPKRAAQCLRIVAEAIHFAHVRGVLHRDLKPSNVMLGDDGTPRVMDFGLAKLLAEDSEPTQSGTVMGSPGYMPPEQALGKAGEIGVRSDVYALGGILYELLTGRPPFRAATPVETLKLVTEQEPVPPRALNPRLPRDLDTICLKCLEKSPARRYATAQELADELGRYLNDEPICARPVSAAEKLWLWCRRKPALASAVSVSFLLLAALALVSTSAAIRLQRESGETLRAKQDAEEKLRASQLAQAIGERLSGVAGRRARGLAAIAAAAKMKPSLELRNEAIACLALNDLGEVRFWSELPAEPTAQAIAWETSLERFARGHANGHVTVERARDRAVLADFDLFRSRPRFVLFSPDGRYLAATAADGAVQVRALDPQVPLAAVAYPPVPLLGNTVAFHANSRWLAVLGRDQRLHFFDVASGERAPTVALGGAPDCLEFSPGGHALAVAVGPEIHRWSWPRLERLKSFKHAARITCLAWHPDGRRLAAGDALGAMLGWDTELDLSITLPAHGQYVSRVMFNPQGDVVASHGWDGFSRFWDAASARPLFATAQGLVTQFSGDGRQVTFHREVAGFGVRDFVRSGSFQTVATILNATGADVSPDGRWLAFAEGIGWHLWDLAAGREAAFVALPRARSPVFHPDGRAVLVVTPDEVMQWPLVATNHGAGLQPGVPRTLLAAKGRDLQRVSFAPDGRRVAVAGRYRSFAFDWQEPERVVTFAANASLSKVAISPDQQWMISTTHNGMGVALWDAAGNLARLLITNDNCVAQFSTDGRSLVTTSSRDYCFWDTQTWQVRQRVKLDLGSAVGGPVAFSPDGRLLAVAASRRDIKLLHPQTGEEFATLTAPDPQNLSRVAFSADGGRLVATTVERAIQIWDLRTLRRELAGIGLDW